LRLSSTAAAAVATTTIVAGGTITAGAGAGTTMIVTGETGGEAGEVGMMIGGIRCGLTCAENDGARSGKDHWLVT
jgi:hypothetical protein